ncbi:unnamed protein product [Ceratitis capitata]|uniref:(Mediterranean fruit fly) hypothetical protein n=1 Tax=Ceratitis capitata TaxID=7213 RepID=A0A811V522_CERCA|nr:unnamed protein product [Ceratitis capitata]
MSLVYITRHYENIKNIESTSDYYQFLKSSFTARPQRTAKKKENVNAIVKLPDGKRLLTDSQRGEHKTMGYSETPLNEPCEFLRKNGGVKWQRKRDHTCPKLCGVAPVPRVEDLRRKSRTVTKKRRISILLRRMSIA